MTDNRIGAQAYSIAAKSAAGATTRQTGSGRRDAWLREMEKQELAAWLNHGLLPVSPRPQPALAHGVQAVQPVWHADHAVVDQAGHGQASGKLPEGGECGETNGATPDAQTVVDAGVEPAKEAGAPEFAAPETIAKQRAALPEPAAWAGKMDDAVVHDFVGLVMGQLTQDMAAHDAGRLALVPDARSGYVLADAQVQEEPVARISGARSVPHMAESEPVGEHESSAKPDDLSEVEQRRATLPRAADELAPPVRVHAFWSDQAVRIWIGAERSAGLNEEQLAYAVQDLRRLLRQQGATLTSLTINGEAIVSEDEQADATPGDGALRPGAPGRAQDAVGNNYENGERK